MSEPDYRNFANKSKGGNYLNKREQELRDEWKRWKAKKDRQKPWYL